MDTTTSIKMTTIAIQNLFSYVEEENLAALKAHLEKFKEVDGRSDVSKQMSEWIKTDFSALFIIAFIKHSVNRPFHLLCVNYTQKNVSFGCPKLTQSV